MIFAKHFSDPDLPAVALFYPGWTCNVPGNFSGNKKKLDAELPKLTTRHGKAQMAKKKQVRPQIIAAQEKGCSKNRTARKKKSVVHVWQSGTSRPSTLPAPIVTVEHRQLLDKKKSNPTDVSANQETEPSVQFTSCGNSSNFL